MILLKGAEVSGKIQEQVTQALSDLQGQIPTLAIIRVGEKPDDLSYERGATKKIEAFGMRVQSYQFEADISDQDFQCEFEKINNSSEIDGILLLRPLPAHINEAKVQQMIDPNKDLDGISPVNMAKVFMGDTSGFAPCTAEAVVQMLRLNEIEIAGRNIVIVGRSMVVGKPLSMLLLAEHATVTICHTKTKQLQAVCRQADILVAAAGRAKMIDGEYVGADTVVIDVGINVDEQGKLCGDVDLSAVSEIAMAGTPVPGGIGVVTTAVLASHLLKAAKRAE